LVAQDVLVKINTRPVYFLHKKAFCQQFYPLSRREYARMAGAMSLQRETPGQPAGGKDLAQGIRNEKIGLILQKSKQFRVTHRIPIIAIKKG
ncbi:hypothetical protein DD582_33050, partial [Klebsiella pneumoniae]